MERNQTLKVCPFWFLSLIYGEPSTDRPPAYAGVPSSNDGSSFFYQKRWSLLEMKKPNDDPFETLHDLSQVLQEKLFDEKLISRDSMIQILHPMGEEDWGMKSLYAKKLIVILNTSKT